MSEISWKNIKDNVWTSFFTSEASKQKIYLKYIRSSQINQNPITIFLFHDLTSYHGRFHHLTTWFQNNFPQVSFILMDYSGHGLSSGTRSHIADLNWLNQDMSFLIDHCDKRADETWIMLGQGMGAIALLDLLNKSNNEKIDKIIVSNFVLNFKSAIFNLEQKIASKFSLNLAMINQSRPMPIYLPKEMLNQIEDQVKYLNDPLIVKAPTYKSLLTINKRIKSLFLESYFLDKPTLMLTGQSPYLIPGGMEAFASGFKKGILTKKSYSNFKHDLYNESESELVFNDISNWIGI